MVFILGRMGNNKKALMLIIERLDDVQRVNRFTQLKIWHRITHSYGQAIDFAKEQKDDDLWEDLLKYSMDKPSKYEQIFTTGSLIAYLTKSEFIRGLLENVGTDIEPLRLIKSIPDGLEIPGLKDALLKILQDYNLQVTLVKLKDKSNNRCRCD